MPDVILSGSERFKPGWRTYAAFSYCKLEKKNYVYIYHECRSFYLELRYVSNSGCVIVERQRSVAL